MEKSLRDDVIFLVSPDFRLIPCYRVKVSRLPHMTLSRRALPFNHPKWLYEIRMDGFRAHAHIADSRCELVSRSGYVYKRFLQLAEQIAGNLRVKNAVLDGEIVCLNAEGKSQFNSLMYRRGTPYFYAFDLLQLDGEDLRSLPLVNRKGMLKRIIPPQPSVVLFMDHIEEKGEALFQLACREDLEGIVAKWKDGLYDCQRVSSWIKIKNPNYSQIIGRDKLFEKRQNNPSGAEPGKNNP